MSRSISIMGMLSFAIILFMTFPANAGKKRIKVGPSGVNVDVDGVQMKADEDGVELNVTGAGVKVDDTGVELRVDGDVNVNVEQHHESTIEVQAVPEGKTRHKPIVCDDNEEKTYTNLFISGRGNGIEIKGNCELTLVNCQIDVRGFAIKMTSNAEVKLINSYIRGRAGALMMDSNAEVDTTGSIFHGAIITKDNAEISKNGGNHFYK